MAKVLPPRGIVGASLRIHAVTPGQRFGRISLSIYPDPLGYGKTPSRFSDPRRRVSANRFGVLYLGESLKVCFVETVLRDQRDGAIGDLPMEETELHQRYYAEIEIAEPVALVDMREDGAVVMGVPTDVVKASAQTLARAWSVAFYEHPERPDGIIYPSRLIGQTNLAVFDRAITKLRAVRKTKLIAVTGLAAVLNDLRVSIVSPDP